MAICELRAISKRYPLGETWVQALSDIDLVVETGEFLALAGPSGSGKTTLLNLVGGLDRPDAGSVYFDGEELTGLSSRALSRVRAAKIGFIFQSFNLIPVLTALENVELALRLSGQPVEVERCRQALCDVGLGELVDRRPTQLSGGQQQRVAIARALVKQPALVIADEPTANLDSKTGEGVLDLMRDLNLDRDVTFIFSTHDPMVIDRARRVVRLRDGRVTGIEVAS